MRVNRQEMRDEHVATCILRSLFQNFSDKVKLCPQVPV